MFSPGNNIPPSLEADFTALRKLRDDDASGALKEFFGEGEDPREWTCEFYGSKEKCVTVADGRVTKLVLSKCTKLAALPAAIGELGALTVLSLYECSGLVALPEAIGKLGALTALDLGYCSSLAALPAAIGELGTLTWLNLYKCSSLVALPTAIGELGALTELSLQHCSRLAALPDAIGKLGALRDLNLGGCSSLTELPAAIGELGALTELYLFGCSSLVALPTPIGELGSLTTLNLGNCKSLAALPDTFGMLGALTELDLGGCSSLTYPPVEMRGDVHQTVGFCCLDLLEGGSVSDDLKRSFVSHLIFEDGHTERLEALVRKDPVFGDIKQTAEAILEVDLAAMRRLRDDDASGVLKEYLGDDEDPREWKQSDDEFMSIANVNGHHVSGVVGGRVTTFILYRCSIVALPAAIGGLGALTVLYLRECSSLAALPDAIGELGALKELDLELCSSLAELPVAIGELGALTEINLQQCSSLTTLPDAIGKLGALKELNVMSCRSLISLPESIAGLDTLKDLRLYDCPNLVFPPGHTHGDLERVKRLLANTTRILDEGLSAADANDDAKADFLDGPIHHAPFADRIEAAVRNDPALANLTDEKGERAIDLACLKCRRAMQRALFFLGRYEIADGPPEHRSATSLVVRALDYEAADDYGRLFDDFDENGDGDLDAGELDRLAAKLGTNVEILKLADGESYKKDAFVAKCQRLFGKERKVVIKIFQVAEQWENEKKARRDQQLDARYVVQTIPAPCDDEFKGELPSYGEFQNRDRFGEHIGSRAIVMDAADRNLLQIYQSERPDLNKIRVLMRETMECVQHLHEKGLVHGDIKMLNVVRLTLDHRLRLIDLDAAAKISAFGGEASYVGSKFSSAVLPPECFARLGADQVRQFETYFSDQDAELRVKVAPKVDKRGSASYVVKTFSLTDDGAPKTDGLPYRLVDASVAVDYWSLGALLFQLVAGEPLVPSNRDDDCVDGNAMTALASWNDDAGKKRLVAIKDAAAFDLASKLLVRDPEKRATFSITDTLARHPFFNPESGDAEIKKQLDMMQTTLETVDAKASSILRLSEENRAELQLTRQVLLKAVFEATEVTTPTTFVVLNEKLPPPFTPEEKTWIETNVVFKDDGSGVEIKGKAPEWFADVEARLLDSMTVAKKGMDLAKDLAKFETNEVLTPGNFKSVIKRGINHFFPTTTLYFYLVDELTGKPVRGAGYPIEIKEPAEKLAQLLPVMQVGLHAMSAYNGVAGLVQMFGYPVPKVPENWRTAAQGSVDLLKQDSSVAAFGVVHKKSKSKDKESSETVRGASLRELKQFFEKKDESQSYAGLRRIGDPADGTAIWTKVKDEDLEATLEARAAERGAEEELRRKDIVENERSLDKETTLTRQVNTTQSVREGSAFVSNDGAGTTTTQPNSHEQNNAVLNEVLVNALAKANGGNSGTCSGSCNCAIA